MEFSPLAIEWRLVHFNCDTTRALHTVEAVLVKTRGDAGSSSDRAGTDPSMSDLGFEGYWLIDSASDADRATVIGLVPPIPRFILLHGFARPLSPTRRGVLD